MENKSQSKKCQNCGDLFVIEADDFNFYEKIKVPAPTFCPECRLIRRMTWRNERSLFKRQCAKTGKEMITMFHPDADVVVYDHDIWWGDSWEPTDFGMDYDFNKPFFEQYAQLLQKTPLANLGNQNCVGSPYGNHNADCKFCYLLYASFNAERVNYSYGAVDSKDCMDIYKVLKSQLSYGDTLCGSLYNTHFSYDSDECIDSMFLVSCLGLKNCLGCVNLRHKSYCIFNVQYTKEEYEEKLKNYDLGSYKNQDAFKKEFGEFLGKQFRRFAFIYKSVNSTGDNILNSKNAKESFDLYDQVEDSKFLIHIWNMKDSYDAYGAGAVASLMYEGVDAGIQSYNQLFSVLAHTCVDTCYTYMCYSSKDLFGCIGLRGKQYCILNKQYSKEEYFELLPKIKEQMMQMPYTDKKGLAYKYGEFFPSELSPFAYNETIAQEYFTKSEKEILKQGFQYRKPISKDYQPTMRSEELPDHIKDIEDSIIEEIISCPNNGNVETQCTQAFRVIKSEIEFLRRNNIPLPRYCPNCRHYARLKQRNPFKLWSGKCQCNGASSINNVYKNTVAHIHENNPCPNSFLTSYAPERPEIVYCEKCYQQEVY